MLFHSLELYIQVAEHVGILEEERNRRNFPLYMRDASPLEIFKIYNRDVSRTARNFLNNFIDIMNPNLELNGEYVQLRDNDRQAITANMQDRGYIF